MTGHSHDHKCDGSCAEHVHDGHNHGGSRRIRVGVKVGNTLGAVYTKCNIHDGAVVISGSLAIESGVAEPRWQIAKELEKAAAEIINHGGVVGHIKAAVSVLSTAMVSVTDEKAMVKEAPARRVRITLAAIVFLVDPGEVESIMRTALGNCREVMLISD